MLIERQVWSQKMCAKTSGTNASAIKTEIIKAKLTLRYNFLLENQRRNQGGARAPVKNLAPPACPP